MTKNNKEDPELQRQLTELGLIASGLKKATATSTKPFDLILHENGRYEFVKPTEGGENE